MSPRSAMAWSSTGPWKANDSVTSPPSPLASTVASSWPRKQTLPSSPKRTTSPGCKLLGRPHEGAPARAVEPLGQRRLDLRLGVAADAPAGQPRRDHARVVDHQRIAGIAADPAGRARRWSSSSGAPPGRTTSSRAASRGTIGPQRDALGRQVEVEQIGAHDYRSSCRGAAMPRAEQAVIAMAGTAAASRNDCVTTSRRRPSSP